MPAAKQVLGYVEEKLRRVFNLAGPIGVTLEPEVKPVIVVDDLRDPGHAFYQGRSFAVASAEQPQSAVGVWVVKALLARDDFVTELLWHSGVIPIGGSFGIQVLGPSEAAPIAGVTFQTGSWRDRKDGTTDFPPVLTNLLGTGTIALNSTVYVAATGTTAALTIDEVLPLKLFIPRGGHLVWAWNAWGAANTNAFNVGMAARVFPQ